MAIPSMMQWWCPMCRGPWGWGMMIFAMIFWLAVLALVVWLVYRLVQGERHARGAGRAEAILRERYARGKIDRETYRRMLGDLREGPEG